MELRKENKTKTMTQQCCLRLACSEAKYQDHSHCWLSRADQMLFVFSNEEELRKFRQDSVLASPVQHVVHKQYWPDYLDTHLLILLLVKIWVNRARWFMKKKSLSLPVGSWSEFHFINCHISWQGIQSEKARRDLSTTSLWKEAVRLSHWKRKKR